MKNDGKSLEKTIRLIQETYKDSPHTTIHNNFKIKNESGNDREIDILIESKINGIELKIAFECKDYSTKVSVEKIEAFNSKCDRIKSINKKIFVSSKGFQKDAIAAANSFGIELFTAETITEDSLVRLLPIRQLKPSFLQMLQNIVVTLDMTEQEIEKFLPEFDGKIYFDEDDSMVELVNVIYDGISQYGKECFNLALLKWMKLSHSSEPEITFPVNTGLTFYKYYWKSKDGQKFKLISATFDFFVKFKFEIPKVIGRSVQKFNGEETAKSLKINLGKDVENEIIIGNDKLDFYLTEKGTTRKLQTLLTYNPKTDKYTFPKKKNGR